MALATAAGLAGETVPVRYREGVVRGFLTLSTLDGRPLADGELIQVARGGRVSSRLVFHFFDGSVHDERAVFLQHGRFRLLEDHLVQRGPAFPRALDLRVNGVSGEVAVRYREADGRTHTESKRMKLPPDVANGLVLTLLKNVVPEGPPQSVSLVAATPSPRLVTLRIASAGTDRFSTGRTTRLAAHYVIKVDIGGIAGIVAHVVGKQPPDSHVWILQGPAPAFIQSEQPLYADGPVWRIQLASPRGSATARAGG